MNKVSKIVLVIAAALSSVACSQVPPGSEGVLVDNYGSDKGVQDNVVGVGYYFTGFGKSLYLFPTFMQTYTYKDDQAITFQSAEGLAITADVGVTYQIDPNNVAKVFQEYRTGTDEITQTFLHNYIRDAMNQVASTMTVEQLVGNGKDQFIDQVNTLVIAEAAQKGITIDKIAPVGTFDIPDAVKQSINAKIQAQQNALTVNNQIATATAEAQKTIIAAQAQAKANQIVSSSLTPELIQNKALDKWNGILPQVTGSGGMPFIKIGAPNATN